MNTQGYGRQLAEERAKTIATLERLTQRAEQDAAHKRTRLKLKLQRLDIATQRLASGQYGQCQACQAPILPERLQALPYAELRFDCQQRLEWLKSGEGCSPEN